jgi:hypothetical protein
MQFDFAAVAKTTDSDKPDAKVDPRRGSNLCATTSGDRARSYFGTPISQNAL